MDYYPVYREPPPQKPSSGSGLLWGVCITVLVAALGASGTLLYRGNQKAETEVQQAVYQAVLQERSRVNECLQTPIQKENPRIRTVGSDGSNKLP